MSGADTSYIKAPVTTVDAETVVSDGLDGILATQPVNTALVSDGAGSWINVLAGPWLIPLFSYGTANDAAPVVEGLARFVPADYAMTDRTTVLTLEATGSVTGAGLTGTLEVLDAADAVVASIDWTETTPTRKTDAITLPGSAQNYRARISCAGVTTPLTEYALIGGALLRITWS